MATEKTYNLRTRDMYHPLYSTYQLDYLRPNVWEIVIGASSPGTVATISQTSANGALTDTSYTENGHSGVSAFSSAATSGLSLYCDKFSLNLPKSNVISVPWISGVTKLAGRNSEGFSINAEFYAGLGAKSLSIIGSNDTHAQLGAGTAVTDDILRLLYAWRNLCFDARSGQIGLAPNYKKPATIFMYDPSGVSVIYEFTVQGLWPSEIGEISLDVSSDDIVKLSVTMQADFIYMEDDTQSMDKTYVVDGTTQAGNTSRSMLYNNKSVLEKIKDIFG